MFAIPSLTDLVTRARRAFRINLPGSDAWVWPNNINPTAKVIAGMGHEIFGFADYIQRQKFALTADEENLVLHGEEVGLAQRAAAPASGAISIVVTDALVVDIGAFFQRSDGIQYRAVVGGSISGAGTLTLDVVADSDGAATSAISGTALDIVSGVSGLGADDALASVGSAGIIGGADIEDTETFRQRILFRKRNPPHGGSAADYVIWASQVSGVTRVFVERLWAGPGSVRVFVLMDELYDDGIPSVPDVQRVADYIATVCPATANVTVAAPLAHPVDITITDLQPNNTDVQEAVRAELRATFQRLSRVAGNDSAIGNMPYLASPTSFSRSWIWQAISNANGEVRDILSVPESDIALSAGEIATVGDVTFV